VSKTKEKVVNLVREYWIYVFVAVLLSLFLGIYTSQDNVLGESTGGEESQAVEEIQEKPETKKNKQTKKTEPKESTATEVAPNEEPEVAGAVTEEGTKQEEDTEEKEKEYISYAVEGAGEYEIPIVAGDTAFSTLLRVAATKNISVGYKQYSFGKMITQIGSKRAEGAYYWALYMNGNYATIGAEDLVVSEGDKLEWRYEAWM
jgi:hypothetical protein